MAPKLGPRQKLKNVGNSDKNVNFQLVALNPQNLEKLYLVKICVVHDFNWACTVLCVEPGRSAAWAKIIPTQVQFGAKLRHVGPKLGQRNWSFVGQSWFQLEPMLRDVRDLN